VPTLIYTEDALPALFVLEDEDEVNRKLSEEGAESVTFMGDGGKEVRVEPSSVKRVSPQ